MNAPLLILPALLGTLALSAAKTLPADLRHDAQGKAPLTVAKMASARGAGSSCRLGCNEPDVQCHSVDGPDNNIQRYEKQVWHQHLECAFAFGSDTCDPEEDDKPCNEVVQYAAWDDECMSTPTHIDYTTSSVCDIRAPH